MELIKKYKKIWLSLFIVLMLILAYVFVVQPYMHQKQYIDNKDNWFQVNDFDYQKMTLNLYRLENCDWKLLDTKTLEKSKTPITFECSEKEQHYEIDLFNEYREEFEDDTKMIYQNDMELFDVSQYGFHNNKGIISVYGNYLLKELNQEQSVFQLSNRIGIPDIETVDIHQSYEVDLEEDEFCFIVTVTFQ